MGKHKDLDTKSFIEWLTKKGETLGFVVEPEYALLKNEYFVDLVWKLRENQDPLVTFEIETKDTARVFSNTAKIFGTSSKLVTKPWRHFMVVYKSTLSKGHKDSLFQVINSHNVFLFENVLNTPEEKQKLEAKLDSLTYDLSALIEKIVSTQPLANSIPIISKGLEKGLAGGFIKDPEVTISIKSRSPQKGKINFSLKIVRQKGELTFLDKLKESQETGKPFTIETPQLKDFVLGEKSLFSSKKGKAKLTVIPKAIKPVKIIVPGTSIGFEEILFRLIKQKGGMDYLSTEKRNLPFVFDLAINKQKEVGNYNFHFEQSVGNVRQYLLFEDFIKALNTKKDLQILDPKNDKVIIGFHVKETMPQDPDWHDLIMKLAYIQEKTNHKLPAPSKITPEDTAAIYRILKVINTGEDSGGTIKSTSIGVNKKTAGNLISILEEKGKISDMEISQDLTYLTIFNEEISLGPSKIKLPDMKFAESIERVKKQVKETDEENTIKLTLVPIKDNKVTFNFENWPT